MFQCVENCRRKTFQANAIVITRISLAANIHWPEQPSTQKLAALFSGNFSLDLLSRFNLSCASFSSLAVSIVSLTVFGPLFETNSARSVFLSSCHLDANASQPSLYFFVSYDANNVKVESVCVSCLYKLFHPSFAGVSRLSSVVE